MKTKKRFDLFALLAQATALMLAVLLAACASRTADTTPPPPPEEGKRQSAQVDIRCTRNADCAVKNVGNCCGAMPACVNKDSPTDPEAVKARCQAQGMMGVCGFREISACQCDNGQCVEAPAANGLRSAPIPTGLPP
jgi:hypothetical protein